MRNLFALALAAAALVASATAAPTTALVEERGEARDGLWFHLDSLLEQQAGAAAEEAPAPAPAPAGEGDGEEEEKTAKDKKGGSTTVLANKNFMSIMEDAEGRQLSPHLAAAEGRLEANEAAKKREHEGARKRAAESNQKHRRHLKAVAAARQREREAAAAKVKAAEEVAKAQSKTAELNRQTAKLRAKVMEAKQKAAARRWRFASGFRAYGGVYGRDVAVERTGDHCTVDGLVRRTSSSARVIGYLPSNCRPSGRLIFEQKMGPRSANHRAIARIDVLSNGAVYLVASAHSPVWISLTGIRFRVGTAGTALALVSNWRPYGGSFRAPGSAAQSGRGGRICTVSGIIRGGRWGYLARVAEGACYPEHRLAFSVSNHVRITRVDLLSNGYMLRAGGGAYHGWVSLDGIVYPGKGSARRTLPLRAGWRHYDTRYWGPARYHRVGNVCMLTGLVRRTAGNLQSAAYVTQLPTGCRPATRLIFGANTHSYSARLDVMPNGLVLYYGGAAASWISLSNVNFIARR